MPLSFTVALSLVMIVLGVAIPAAMCVIADRTSSLGAWASGLMCWLVVVVGWVVLQFHLHSLAPHYFTPGHWDAINGWSAVIAIILVVASFLLTADD